jgi:hypothetical protein
MKKPGYKNIFARIFFVPCAVENSLLEATPELIRFFSEARIFHRFIGVLTNFPSLMIEECYCLKRSAVERKPPVVARLGRPQPN